MPFLRDEGPPIPQASIQKMRESLPVEYGWQVVNETGREVLVVRVPKAKPDYLHDLAEVAFYVGIESVRNTKDILLVGHDKTARLEPQLLRDHIRAQAREDASVVEHLRRQLDRQYGHTFVTSPSNHQHSAFAVRIPKETVAQFTPEDVNAIRHLVTSLHARVMGCQYAYVVANGDHERLGRRTLLELIGETTQQAPAPAASPLPSPPAPEPQAAHHIVFPSATPGAPAAPAPAFAQPPAAAAPLFAPAPVAPTPPATPPSPASPPVADATVAQAPAPSAPASPAPAGELTAETEEYEIVSKPKARAPVADAPAAPAPRLGLDGAEVVHDEYEIVSKPKAAPAPPVPAAPAHGGAQPAPEASAEPDAAKHVLREDKEFEVFTSKPKPRAEAPAITPPGMAGFQAALAAGTGPAPSRTKEYEIIGRTSVTSDPSIASKLRLPTAAPPPAPGLPLAAAAAPLPPQPMTAAPFVPPAPQQAPMTQPTHAAPAAHAPPVYAPTPSALPPYVATPTAPADSGAPMVVRAAPAAPELILAQRFKEAGYEVVDGLRAQGTAFAFAAHKPNGRRVLVHRTDAFAAEGAATLAQLVVALGADVALVVADTVKPGTRLATWGTRIEVVTPADVPALTF